MIHARFAPLIFLSLAISAHAQPTQAADPECALRFKGLSSRLNAPAKPRLHQIQIETPGGIRTLEIELLNASGFHPVYAVLDETGARVLLFKPEVGGKLGFTDFLASFDFLTLTPAYEKNWNLQRERIVSRLGQQLKLHVTTPEGGVAVANDGTPGSIQTFLNGFREARQVGPGTLQKLPRNQVQEMLLLDALLGNWDRHLSNFLIRETESLPEMKVIDHGMTFSMIPYPRFSNNVVPRDVFPQALGVTDPEVAHKFLELPSSFVEKLLRENQVPEAAIVHSLKRLATLKKGLGTGMPIEKIVAQAYHVSALNYRRVVLAGGAWAVFEGGRFVYSQFTSPSSASPGPSGHQPGQPAGKSAGQ